MTYVKARFASALHGNTAGIVINSADLCGMDVQSLSRLFPFSESLKMERVEVSPHYDTWNEAFAHDFDKVQDAD